jgi:hypothetical protein
LEKETETVRQFKKSIEKDYKLERERSDKLQDKITQLLSHEQVQIYYFFPYLIQELTIEN